MEFRNWLEKQTDREDKIGAFAREFADTDPSKLKKRRGRRKRDLHKRWANLITRRGNREWVMVFNRAWQEFSREQEEAEAAPA